MIICISDIRLLPWYRGFTLLVCYTMCVGICVPVFQDNIPVPPSVVKQTNIQCIKTQKSEDLELFAWF